MASDADVTELLDGAGIGAIDEARSLLPLVYAEMIGLVPVHHQ
jgi:hypothetical protein